MTEAERIKEELEATIRTLEQFIVTMVKPNWPQPIGEEVDPIVGRFCAGRRKYAEDGSSGAVIAGVSRATDFLDTTFSNPKP